MPPKDNVLLPEKKYSWYREHKEREKQKQKNGQQNSLTGISS